MKNVTKRLLTFALALVVAVTAFGTVSAEAALKEGTNYQKSTTVYLSSKTYPTTYYSSLVTVRNLSKSQTIAKKDVKSSKTSVASVYSLTYNTSTYDYYEKVSWANTSPSYSYDIGLCLKEAGSAKISFKVKGDKKTYSTTVNVKEYTNPISSAKITGINSGKELKSKTADQARVSFANKKDIKNAKATFKVSGDWRISSVTFNADNWNEYHSYYCSSNAKSKTISLGTLKKNVSYGIYVHCYNTKTNGSLSVYYYINN
ncbi:MAG: hypothetical protein ACI4AD_09995 [Roseburia sp.]